MLIRTTDFNLDHVVQIRGAEVYAREFEYVAEPGADEVNNTTTRTSVGLGYKF